MRWSVMGLILSIVVLAVPTSWAYEKDVHYHLTRYLAMWAGFSEGEAEEIAKADQGLDDNPATSAVPDCKHMFGYECRSAALGVLNEKVLHGAVSRWRNDPSYQRMITAQRAYHFVDGKRLEELRSAAFRGRNLKTLGHYLHALQDTFSHSLMDYKDLPSLDKLAANLGYMPDEQIIGHLAYGHSVDKTQERPDLAELMAQFTYKELIQFRGPPTGIARSSQL